MDFSTFEDTYKELEKFVDEPSLEKINRKVIKQAIEIGHAETVKLIKSRAYSSDNSKSGRKGARPSGHAGDNVPKKVTKTKDYGVSGIVGWDRSDRTEYFYMKFQEFGTSSEPPHQTAKNFIKDATKNSQDEMQAIMSREYEKALSEVLE